MFRLFENNGVLKRDLVDDIVKSIKTDERKKIWELGIKIGRYHIYLPKMLKPKAVSLRISLWRLFFEPAGETPTSAARSLWRRWIFCRRDSKARMRDDPG